MIFFLYNLLIFLQAVYVLGNIYTAVKFYKIPHRWGRFVAVAFAANAFQALLGIFTLGFGPRPARVVWWSIVLTLAGQIARAGGIAVLTLFLFGWINGVGNYAKKGEANDQ